MKSKITLVILGFLIFAMLGCASFPKPNQVPAPMPIPDNSGEYMCPYTQDDTVAEWVDIGATASAASTIGKAIGREAGSRVISSIPLVGSLFGQKAGDAAGRAIAIKACGGWEKIRASSDQSFNSLQDLAAWLYVTKSAREDYKKVLKLTGNINPKLERDYNKLIKKAYKQSQKTD